MAAMLKIEKRVDEIKKKKFSSVTTEPFSTKLHSAILDTGRN
jgi:hypothetical protein